MDYEECTSLNAMNGTAIGKKLTEPSVVISTLQEKKSMVVIFTVYIMIAKYV